MKTSLKHFGRAKTGVILISSRWLRTLTFPLFFQAKAGSYAQQLTFADPVPFTQLIGSSIGTVKIVVLNTNGNLVTNSSAPIILSDAGPGTFSLGSRH